jgi:hypothetical protein
MRRLLVVLLSLWLLVDVALAAVTPNSTVFPQTPHTYRQRFVTADTIGTYKTVVTGLATGGAAGTRCNALWVVTDDTAVPHLLTFRITRGGAPYPGPAITTNQTQTPQSILNPTLWPGLPNDSDGNLVIFLDAGDLLEVTYATAITAAKIIGIHAECWDF